MSKTLPSVAPTLEDRDVWWWHVERRGREFSATKAIFCVYAAADRRDAELMQYLMRKPPHIVRLWVAMRTAVNANLLFAGRLT